MPKNYLRICGIFLLIGISIFSFYNIALKPQNNYQPIINTIPTESPNNNYNGVMKVNHIVLSTESKPIEATTKITIVHTIKITPTPKPIITPTPIITPKPIPVERHTQIKNNEDAQKVQSTNDGVKTYNLAYQPPLYLGYEYYYVGDYAVWYATLSNIGDTDIIYPVVRISSNGVTLLERNTDLIIKAHSNIQFYQDFNIPNAKGFWKLTIDLIDNGKTCISFYKEINIL